MNTEMLNEVVADFQSENWGLDLTPRRPSRALIACLTAFSRNLRDWKAQTLADFAGVSLSTVERVERGEVVSEESLDRIADTLGYGEKGFTRLRQPKGRDATIASVHAEFHNLAVVEVAQLTTQRQIRALSAGHMVIKLGLGWSEEANAEMENLTDLFELIAMVRNEDDPTLGPPPSKRQMYGWVFGCVEKIKRAGMTLVVGQTQEIFRAQPELVVNVLAISPREKDPGALKRKVLLLNRSDVLKTMLGTEGG